MSIQYIHFRLKWLSKRCYVGRYGDSEIVHRSDGDIVKSVLADLELVMNMKAEPLFFKVTRWHEAMPQYQVGHPYKIEKLKEDLHKKFSGLYVAGAAIAGVGLPDCIDQGEAAVREISPEQDLVKNVYLSNEKSWLRKTKEVLIAINVESMVGSYLTVLLSINRTKVKEREARHDKRTRIKPHIIILVATSSAP